MVSLTREGEGGESNVLGTPNIEMNRTDVPVDLKFTRQTLHVDHGIAWLQKGKRIEKHEFPSEAASASMGL